MAIEQTEFEFKQYITNTDHYFINRWGGIDINLRQKYINDKNIQDDNNLNFYIKELSGWTGYYDTSTNINIRRANLQKYFNELYEIYISNKFSTIFRPTFPKELFLDTNFKDLNIITYDMLQGKSFFSFILTNFKKILIISAFTEKMETQVCNLNKMYDTNSDNTFSFIKTYLTYYDKDRDVYMNTSHNNFWETLQYYKDQIDTIDFDICLISCGTYAHFIGEYIKSINKKSIYIGGILTLYFGIYGDLYLKPNAKWFDLNYCILNTHNEIICKNQIEACNSYLYNDYKYTEILQSFDYQNNYKNLGLNEIGAKIQHIMQINYNKNYNYINLPDDFNWKIYIEKNSDLKHLNEYEVTMHYETTGYMEKRLYK